MMPEQLAKSRFRVWIVDLDGTLYSPIPLKLAMAAELAMFGHKHIAFIRHFRRAHEAIRNSASAEDCAELGRTPFERQLEMAATKAQVELPFARGIVNEWMIQRPCKWVRMFRRHWLLNEIAQFRSRGGRTAIVSDYPADAKLNALQATDLFDAVVSNGESNAPTQLKPDPQGIQLAMNQLDAESYETLMIGDRDDCDGEAAHRAGISFWNVRSGRFSGLNARNQCETKASPAVV